MSDALNYLAERYLMLQDERTLLDLEIMQAEKDLMEKLGATSLGPGEEIEAVFDPYTYRVKVGQRRQVSQDELRERIDTTKVGEGLMNKGIVQQRLSVNWGRVDASDLSASEISTLRAVTKVTRGPVKIEVVKTKVKET